MSDVDEAHRGQEQHAAQQTRAAAGEPTLMVIPISTGRYAFVALTGEADLSTVDQIRAAAEQCLSRHPQQLAIDLRGLRFCDCSGIRVLREIQSDAEAVGTQFLLRAPSAWLRRVFDLADAHDLLTAVQDRATAHSAPPSARPEPTPAGSSATQMPRQPDRPRSAAHGHRAADVSPVAPDATLLTRVRQALAAAGLDAHTHEPMTPGLHLSATDTGVTISWHPTPEMSTPALERTTVPPTFSGIRDALHTATIEVLTGAGMNVTDSPTTGNITVTDPTTHNDPDESAA